MSRTTIAAPGVASGTRRVLARRRRLPGSRAVVGALLVVGAAVGTFAAYLASTSPPTDRWLAATRPVARGEVLTAAHLEVVAADLPAAQGASVLRASQLEQVVGTTAAVPIGRGAFVQGSMVHASDQLDGELLAFSLPADRALGGGLVAGAVIDLVATYGSGADASTVYVVRGVPVTRVGGAAGSLGGATTVVTVLLPDLVAVQRVAHALGNAEVWLVRSAGGGEAPPPWSGAEATGGRS